jgi:hypothetical protein
MVYEDKMNAGTMIKFMERLFRDAARKVFLILGNQKFHHSHAVKDWLPEHKDPIEVFFLPSYFPKLNPDEYLKCDLKTSAPSGVAARTKDQLKKKAISHLRKLKN